jgi:hypothetical protein
MTALLSVDGSAGIKKVLWVLNLLRDEHGYPRPEFRETRGFFHASVNVATALEFYSGS